MSHLVVAPPKCADYVEDPKDHGFLSLTILIQIGSKEKLENFRAVGFSTLCLKHLNRNHKFSDLQGTLGII